MRTASRLAAASLSIVFLSGASAAYAATENFTADLKAASEVPATDSKGTGALTATYDTASKKLTYTVSYKDLTGPATAAHFHGPADAKTNAGVVVPVKEITPATLKGEATLTDAQAADLEGGKWYFNIHTAANKGGEIRGQVMKK
jgi:hypothetical protein